MNDAYIAHCFIESYFDDKIVKDELIITGISSYTEAMRQIEEYYGDDLYNVTISLKEGPFYYVSSYDIPHKEA